MASVEGNLQDSKDVTRSLAPADEEIEAERREFAEWIAAWGQRLYEQRQQEIPDENDE